MLFKSQQFYCVAVLFYFVLCLLVTLCFYCSWFHFGLKMESSDQSWLRRFRSSSLTSDFDVQQDNFGIQEHSTSYQKHAIGTESTDRCHSLSPDEYTASLIAGREQLRGQPNYFPFHCLTDDCKLHIFSQLSLSERGIAATVCRSWSQLMRTPSLWSVIDLVIFPPYPPGGDDVFSPDDNVKLYETYRTRVRQFVAYLVSVRPIVRVLRFEFDIGDLRDGWLEMLRTLFCASLLHELQHAELGWTDTPCKPYVPDNSSATWCATDCKDLMYRHRHRQRLFVKLFDLFTAVAVNIVSLTIPFDWTERSLHALHRLSNLKVLNLQKYFLFQPLDQNMIDTLFTSVPLLRRLTMEVWTPSGRGFQSFRLCSEQLQFLDVSRCRGFCIEDVDLPRLMEFRVSICPMNGPLVSGEGIDMVCVYNVVKSGAPSLCRFNEHELKADWRSTVYEELDNLLKSVCACAKHQLE